MSRMILVKARVPKVEHQKVEFQRNKRGPWHSTIANVWSDSKRKGDLKVSHLMNRNHPDSGKPFTADELLGENSKHGIRFVGGPNSAVQEAYPHHSLSSAGEGDSDASSSESSSNRPDTSTAQAPDPGQTKLTDFGKAYPMALDAAWDVLLKAIPESVYAHEAYGGGRRGDPEETDQMVHLRNKIEQWQQEGMGDEEISMALESEIDDMMSAPKGRVPEMGEAPRAYVGEEQQITPPVPDVSTMRQNLQRRTM